MKKQIILITLVSLAVVPATASAAALPRFRTSLIVPGQSAGGVSLGERSPVAIKAWGGNASCVPSPALTSCTWGSDSNGSTGNAQLLFAHGKVNGIKLTLGNTDKGAAIYRGPLMKLKTKKGIGMRSTDAQLVKAYPHQVGTNDLGPTLGSGAHTTTFQTSAGGFVTIIIGTPPDV
jgi:hypothetical protein